MEFHLMLESYNVIIFCLVVGYGVLFGLGNLVKRTYCLFSTKHTFSQSTEGQLLDAVWLAGVVYLVILVMNPGAV